FPVPIVCFFHSQGGTSTTIKNYLKIFSAWRGFKQSWGNSSNRSQQLKICDCSICCERSDTRCSNVSVSYLYTAAIAPGSGATHRLELAAAENFDIVSFANSAGAVNCKHNFEARANYRSWHFPLQSSGGFGDQTLGRWLRYDEVTRSSEEFLRRREAGGKSIFWSGNKSYGIWTDYHAQYVEQRVGSPQ